MWRSVLIKMGINEDQLHPVTIQTIANAAKLVERAGGTLDSRQVIAGILVTCEPNLNLEEPKENV